MKGSGDFFDGFATRFDSLYDSKRSWFWRWFDQRFRSDIYIRFAVTFEFLGDLSGKSILDIGCGSGPYIEEALRRGASHVTGIDPAPRMLDLARKRVERLGMLDRISLHQGYFPYVTPAEKHDYAIVMGVMDYIRDPEPFLRSVCSNIRCGAAISFPSLHWFRTPIRKVRYLLRRCPVYFYTERKINLLMSRAGSWTFTVTKIPGAGMDYVVCATV